MSQVNADRINLGMGVKIPTLTQSQINSCSNRAGDIVYNSTEESMQVYNALDGVWEFIGSGAELYEFQSVTFTPGGSSGRDGPSLAQVRSGITGNDAWKNDTQFLQVNSGKISWTVPTDGEYQIQAEGAQGGRSNCYGPAGGQGARMQGTFSLIGGEQLQLVVGQKGSNQCYDCGGGGASYVCDSSNSALIVAAGGGGGSASGMSGPGPHWGRTNNQGGSTSWATGGTANNGGGGMTAGGGGGVTGNGGGSWYGRSFTNGSQGGPGPAPGGFGGGGGGGQTNGAGGGGGYGGGGASYWSFYGAGGGSYNGGTNPSNQNNAKSNDGSISITKIA